MSGEDSTHFIAWFEQYERITISSHEHTYPPNLEISLHGNGRFQVLERCINLVDGSEHIWWITVSSLKAEPIDAARVLHAFLHNQPPSSSDRRKPAAGKFSAISVPYPTTPSINMPTNYWYFGITNLNNEEKLARIDQVFSLLRHLPLISVINTVLSPYWEIRRRFPD